MANPTNIQNASASLVSAASTLTIGTVSGAAVGDLLIAWCSAERGSITPTMSGGSSAWTLLANLTNTNHTTGLYYKRIGSGDLAATVVGNVTSTRRLSGGFVTYRGAVDPVISVKTAVTGATTSAVSNSMTPTVADSTLLTFYTAVSVSTPWIRTFGSYTSGWTERVQISGQAPANSNPFSTMLEKNLTGGSGVAQAFSNSTISAASEYNEVSIVLAPGTVNVAPNAYMTASQTDGIEPGQTVTLTLSDDDDVAVVSRTLTQLSGTTVAPGGSGSTRTVLAPYVLGGDALVYGYSVSDGTLTSEVAIVTLNVLPPTDYIVTTGGSSYVLQPVERLIKTA